MGSRSLDISRSSPEGGRNASADFAFDPRLDGKRKFNVDLCPPDSQIGLESCPACPNPCLRWRIRVAAGQSDIAWSVSRLPDSCRRTLRTVDRWANVRKCDSSLLDVMGFSQGAMMVYALGLLHPERIRLSAALAGYLPSPWLAERPLDRINNKAYFIAHGTQDDTFPVERARDTANQLK